MFTLILIISLKSQFHHDIDVKQFTANLPHEHSCHELADKISSKLKSKNADIEVEHLCVLK